MSLLERIRGKTGKELLKVEKASTDYGQGFRIQIKMGDGKNTQCDLIRDKETGEWVTLGDPRACQILTRNLQDIGTPFSGLTTGEKLKEQKGL